MKFYGVDLAWSSNNLTGVACIEGDKVVFAKCVKSLDEISSLIENNSHVGIDAPLVVFNKTGSRESEKLLNREFSKFQAGAYYVNRNLLGENRGEKLLRILRTRVELVEEVFPHSIHVNLFELDKTLKYKSRHNKDIRLDEFKRYLNYLREFIELPQQLLVDVSSLKNKELKELEDKLDAITCALAMKYNYHYPNLSKKYGEILVPSKP